VCSSDLQLQKPDGILSRFERDPNIRITAQTRACSPRLPLSSDSLRRKRLECCVLSCITRPTQLYECSQQNLQNYRVCYQSIDWISWYQARYSDLSATRCRAICRGHWRWCHQSSCWRCSARYCSSCAADACESARCRSSATTLTTTPRATHFKTQSIIQSRFKCPRDRDRSHVNMLERWHFQMHRMH